MIKTFGAMRTNHIKFFAVPPAPTFVAKGFTLIELAIVLFVVALLLGGMLLPLAGQQDIRNYGDTQKILIEAREALLGYAMANDRLPCPATDDPINGNSLGKANPETGGPCANPHGGFLPAVTLGLSPVDAQGFRLDGWGGETVHRLRYAVTTANINTFSTTNGMKTTGMTALAPDLEICSSGAQIRIPPVMTAPDTATMYCHPSFRLAGDAVAVIYSLGKNAGTGGNGADENHNPNPQSTIAADRAFVNAQQGIAFDDQLLWLSKSTLFNRMVAAGRLP
jgi:prepilin-type N-terminal cleavage/methylation domain-containing protein